MSRIKQTEDVPVVEEAPVEDVPVVEEAPIEDVPEKTSCSSECFLLPNESIEVINGKKYILVTDEGVSYHKKDENGIEITL